MALVMFGPEFHVRFIINEHVFHANIHIHISKKNTDTDREWEKRCKIPNQRQQPIDD